MGDAKEPVVKTDGSGVHPDGSRDKPSPDAKAAGESHPDSTTTDNPSGTGFPTVNSQTPGAKTTESETHTMRYGEDTSGKKPKSADGVDSVRAAAEKAVLDRNGTEQYRQNPNFENDVKEAERQIRESIEKNKDM